MVKTRTRVMRRVIVLTAGAMLVASCSGTATTTTTTPTTSPPTTATTTTTAPPTTTVAPTTTTSTTTTVPPTTTTTVDPLARPDKLVSNFDRDSVDDFNTTGDDLYRIILELDDLYNYFEGNPTETLDEMMSLMFTEDYPAIESQREFFGELVDNDWHYVDAGIETVAVEILDVSENEVSIRTATRRGEQRIADASGTIVKTYPGWETDAAIGALRRGTDGRWRYASGSQGTVITDEELASMVPVEWSGRQQ